jgi:hypothetical protein
MKEDELETGYARLANDPEYRTEKPRRFTQRDLDEAFSRGYREGYNDATEASTGGGWYEV